MSVEDASVYKTNTPELLLHLHQSVYPHLNEKKLNWTNIPDSILAALPRQLHLQPSHPISLTRRLIESCFPPLIYKYHNNLSPIVSTHQNFDSLGFPIDHPGRNRTDTYYINKSTVLRTHTSAHQADIFTLNESSGFLISADVYRRDAIDKSHYPVFHQMEGARMWDRRKVTGGDVTKAVYADLESLPKHSMQVSDLSPTVDPNNNPLQSQYHTIGEVEAMAAHLKRSIEGVVDEIFTQARLASLSSSNSMSSTPASLDVTQPLQIRWVEAYFPFTSPSWELEIFWQGSWLEVLGCGIVKQSLFNDAGVPDQVGWAFGIGLERIAMLLFEIPDIRLFWSRDERFLCQFTGLNEGISPAGGNLNGHRNDWGIKQFVPFSKYPASPRDLAFWLCSPDDFEDASAASKIPDFHENDFMEVVRDVGGDLVEDVQRMDEFVHPETRRISLCYRIVYRSLERTLKGEEVNQLHMRIGKKLKSKLGVKLR